MTIFLLNYSSKFSLKPAVGAGHGSRGFALVITVVVMSLLMLVGVAMLSLSSVSTRTASESQARLEAEANAKMGLMIALAKLQEEMGADQRISAYSDILDENPKTPQVEGVMHNGWLGVWNARKSSDRPSYERGRAKNFRTWMVSSRKPELSFTDAKTLALDPRNTVVMGRNAQRNVEVKAEMIDTLNGKLAWHVGDNSTRARSNLGKKSDLAMDAASLIARRTVSERHAPEVIENLQAMDTSEATAVKIFSDDSVELAANNIYSDHENALTAQSYSLLTNTAEGGLKKDINSLFEINDVSKFKDLGYGAWKGREATNDSKNFMYGPKVALGARWNSLYAYYNLYKDAKLNKGVPEVQPKGGMIDWNLADNYINFGDDAGGFRFPRIAKVTYLFSYKTVRTRVDKKLTYRLTLVTDTVISLWNPYNARIVFPENCCMYIKLSKAIPMKFNWHVNGASVGEASLDKIIPDVQRYLSDDQLFIHSKLFRQIDGRDFTMDPGETVVFTMDSPHAVNQIVDPDYQPGIRYNMGLGSDTILGKDKRLEGNLDDKISVSLKPDKDISGYIGKSQYLDFWIMDKTKNRPFYEHRGEVVLNRSAALVDGMASVEQEDVTSVSFGQALDKKIPFGALIIEMKTSRDSVKPSKIFLHSGLTRLSSRIGSNSAEEKSERFEYRLEPITDINSDLLQVSTANSPHGANHGYIGGGGTPDGGVTHMAHSGIPVLPLTSLAQFRHAGVGDGATSLRATQWGYESSPNPPYMDYAVGNSYAHPLLAKNVKLQANGNRDYYDHSYFANEILWDDYFCSSLVDQSKSILQDKRSLDVVWGDFINSKGVLLNDRYLLHKGNKSISKLREMVLEGSELRVDAHKKIAGNLLYDGGFNVNSTEVDAWRAFLSGSSKSRVQILQANLNNPLPKVEESKGVVFSRTSLPLGSSFDDAKNPAEKLQRAFQGYRDLDDTDIMSLAEKIVEQVKLRGPFLNVADFINRQLSKDVEMAKMGALQAAIDKSGVNDEMKEFGVTVPADASYSFPEATAGNTVEGAAGWLMQADILSQVGSSIFVRGDTFTIRAYGDSRDSNGNILSVAMCEATVQRYPEYINPAEKAEVSPAKLPVNVQFGREFQIIGFRWLRPNEID